MCAASWPLTPVYCVQDLRTANACLAKELAKVRNAYNKELGTLRQDLTCLAGDLRAEQERTVHSSDTLKHFPIVASLRQGPKDKLLGFEGFVGCIFDLIDVEALVQAEAKRRLQEETVAREKHSGRVLELQTR